MLSYFLWHHHLYTYTYLANFVLIYFIILLSFLNVYLLILERQRQREREKERERNINLLFHLFMHSFVDSVCALTRNWTCNLGVQGWRTIQLSFPARACCNLSQNYIKTQSLRMWVCFKFIRLSLNSSSITFELHVLKLFNLSFFKCVCKMGRRDNIVSNLRGLFRRLGKCLPKYLAQCQSIRKILCPYLKT